jgi:hypothetical protein
MTETRRQNDLLAKRRRLLFGMSVLGLCLLLLSGCAVPGGYDVNSLHLQPEAALVYPGSTDVHTNDYNGRPGNYVSKGAVAATGKSGTTIHTQLEVLAYFSKTLAADGWRQSYEIVRDTTPEGFPAHLIQWDKSHLHLAYDVKVWTDGEATKYFTQLMSDE